MRGYRTWQKRNEYVVAGLFFAAAFDSVKKVAGETSVEVGKVIGTLKQQVITMCVCVRLCVCVLVKRG